VKEAYVAMDQWLALKKAFASFKCLIGKQYTKAIEGNGGDLPQYCDKTQM
jgi:IS1 family transposase